MATTKKKDGKFTASTSTLEAKAKARELAATWATLTDKQRIEALYYMVSRLTIGDR